jgi:DNA topoisomerase-3
VLKLKDTDTDTGGARPEADRLSPVAEGQTFENAAATVTEHYTQPPKPYTEDTLLSAMENAGAEETDSEAERRGLGTPATRAAVIEKLVNGGFIKRNGRNLIPTPDGENLIKILPGALKSPELTAEWENALTQIAKGEAKPDGFMQGIEEMARTLITDYAAPIEEFIPLFDTPREIIGVCPRCGKSVFESKKNFHCENRDCQFVMWKTDRFFTSRKKELTKATAAELLKSGKAAVKGMYSEKKNKTFDAVILLSDTGGKYVNYRFEINAGNKAGA